MAETLMSYARVLVRFPVYGAATMMKCILQRGVFTLFLAITVMACNSSGPQAAKPSTPTKEKAVPKKGETVKPVAPKKESAAPVKQEKPAAVNQHPAMTDPTLAKDKAPDQYKVKFETTKGDIIINVTRAWAPQGADRFYNLVKIGYFTDIAMFRVISGFMAQFGIHGDPAVNQVWRAARIKDDPVKESNKAGYVTFATSGANSRTTQVFINFGNNANLDGMGFSPFGKVEDMTTMNKIHSGYGEGAPRGRGPHQGRMQAEGNVYLKKAFPDLDYIKKATLL